LAECVAIERELGNAAELAYALNFLARGNLPRRDHAALWSLIE
jgi:hypothetical protein